MFTFQETEDNYQPAVLGMMCGKHIESPVSSYQIPQDTGLAHMLHQVSKQLHIL